MKLRDGRMFVGGSIVFEHRSRTTIAGCCLGSVGWVSNHRRPPLHPLRRRAGKKTSAQPKHKIGPFEITINWRTRAEGWNWFQGKTGNSDYPLWDSLLRIGIGQTRERLDWFAEMEQASILGLPNDAVVAAPQGQLGLGGNYYAANKNQVNNASVFLKQAYVDFKHLGPTRLKLGRFEYFDGTEVKAADPTLATVVQTRISSRLISNFAFAAVQRTFDGGQFALEWRDRIISHFSPHGPPPESSRWTGCLNSTSRFTTAPTPGRSILHRARAIARVRPGLCG